MQSYYVTTMQVTVLTNRSEMKLQDKIEHIFKQMKMGLQDNVYAEKALLV